MFRARAFGVARDWVRRGRRGASGAVRSQAELGNEETESALLSVTLPQPLPAREGSFAWELGNDGEAASVAYRTRQVNRTRPPSPGASGSITSQRSTRESPWFGSTEKLAPTLDCALPGTYSRRVVRLSMIVTLPITSPPTLSKRSVK